uniref:(northern house mosquito) hypothetical protein n=1 Tax=Culex pipiens TaxID=7175 RepID=A0A8D8BPU7_CULPI
MFRRRLLPPVPAVATPETIRAVAPRRNLVANPTPKCPTETPARSTERGTISRPRSKGVSAQSKRHHHRPSRQRTNQRRPYPQNPRTNGPKRTGDQVLLPRRNPQP